MTLIMAGTIGAGFISSVSLYYLGMDDLAWRYVLSLIICYLMFLVLIRLWLIYIFGFKKGAEKLEPGDLNNVDVFDGVYFKNLTIRRDYQGQGGNFSGGGSSGSWGESLPSLKTDLDFDADEAAPLIVGIILVGLILACLGFGVYLIYEAPSLLAEIALEMAISLGLLKKIKNQEGNWLEAALKKTIFFFLGFTLIIFIALKWITNKYPEVKRSKDLITLIKRGFK